MIKWFRRLVLYPLGVLVLLIVVTLMLKKNIYYSLKGTYGTMVQYYGHEEKGNALIEEALSRISNVPSSMLHHYSVQNTKNGNYDEATRYLDRGVEMNPEDGDGYYGWVLLYYYRDYKRALFHLYRLDLATDEVDYVGDDNILYAKALCHKQLKDYEKALDLFKQAIDHEIRTHNESWVTHQMLFQTGRTLHLLNREEEAIEYYDKAIEVWDGSSESIYYKGLAELDMGNKKGCENLDLALTMVKKDIKSSDIYVGLFDEIYVGQVEEMIAKKCIN